MLEVCEVRSSYLTLAIMITHTKNDANAIS